ncbi:helix-turn-helix domain-containing protein [Enterobacter sp. 22452]|uniref:helix-turn-helix domain-containing protein n=1 Tax=Enterobacter TaxID=547 RepID=UPI003F8796D8
MYDNKPITSIRTIISRISQPSRIVNAPRGALISFDNSCISDGVLLHSGVVLLRRRMDDRILGHISGPEFYGFDRFICVGEIIYLEAMSTVEFEICPVEQMFQVVECQKLWPQLVDSTLYLMSSLFKIYTVLSQHSSFRIVCALLQLLSQSPTELINTITVIEYIKQSSNLSRSSILKHLAALKKNGTLQMENGYLKSFIHDSALETSDASS